MKAFVVVAGAVLVCKHNGRVQILSGNSKLTAGGHDVVLSGQEAGISFETGSPGVQVSCPLTTNAGPSPCTATLKALSGVTLKVTVGGVGVLLHTATGNVTNANDAEATWTVSDPGQQKVVVSLP
jgi:hypothetical protein